MAVAVQTCREQIDDHLTKPYYPTCYLLLLQSRPPSRHTNINFITLNKSVESVPIAKLIVDHCFNQVCNKTYNAKWKKHTQENNNKINRINFIHLSNFEDSKLKKLNMIVKQHQKKIKNKIKIEWLWKQLIWDCVRMIKPVPNWIIEIWKNNKK